MQSRRDASSYLSASRVSLPSGSQVEGFVIWIPALTHGVGDCVLDQPKREGTGSTLRTGAQLYFHPLMPFNAAHRHLEIQRCRCPLVCLHPSRGSRTSLCPAFREHSEASTIRVRNGRIGSIDPSALKIPARRAESSLVDQFHILIFTLSQHNSRPFHASNRALYHLVENLRHRTPRGHPHDPAFAS